MKDINNIKRVINGIQMYNCNKCKEWKIGDEFTIDRANKIRDMHRPRCRSCVSVDDHIAKGYITNYIAPIVDGKLYCTGCESYLDKSMFWNYFKNDHRERKLSKCKTCSKELNIKTFNESATDRKVDLVLSKRIYSIIERCKKKGVELKIDAKYLRSIYDMQNGVCNVSGLVMDINLFKGRNRNILSIDRIDSRLGYVEGNIQLVCDFVNRMKLDYTEEEFIEMCRLIYNKNKYKYEV